MAFSWNRWLSSAFQPKKHSAKRKIVSYRIGREIEGLENRIVPALMDNLIALRNASGVVGGFAANLNANDLKVDYPVLSDAATLIDKITTTTATFSQISTKLGEIDTSTAAIAVFQNALNNGVAGAPFTVTQFNNAGVFVTYSLSLNATTPALAVANTLGDFFGDAAPSYLDTVTLNGTANAALSGSTFQVTFGADASGFVVKAGNLFK